MMVRKIFPILLAMILAVSSGCANEHEETDILPDTEPEETVSAAEVDYTLKVVDQKGRTVPGVVVRVCNAEACVMAVSDERGLCELKLLSGVYDIIVLNVPDGYEPVEEAFTAPSGGGEVVVRVNRSNTLTKGSARSE